MCGARLRERVNPRREGAADASFLLEPTQLCFGTHHKRRKGYQNPNQCDRNIVRTEHD